MLSPMEIAKIKAEIEALEKAFRNCADSGLRKVIEDWIESSKQKLASAQKSK